MDDTVKSTCLMSAVVTIVVLGFISTAAAKDTIPRAAVTTNLSLLPLAFTENHGQWDKQVLFRTGAGGATMWFTKNGAWYQFARHVCALSENNLPNVTLSRPGPTLSGGVEGWLHQPDSIETMMIKASFVGSNPNPRMIGEKILEYKCNYFIGNDPAKWRTDVPNYRTVVYKNIYPGIDLKYYGNGKKIEYDFTCFPRRRSVTDSGALRWS